MTPEQAKDLLVLVARHAMNGDDESAHAAEDDLRTKALEAILEAVAEGRTNDAAELAAVALRSGNISFARWCA